MTAIYRPLEYRAVSAAGTVGETHARLMRRANLARNLTIPRTTGMPHRPTSSDGQPSIFVSSNPIGRALTLVEGCPSLRWPQPRYRRLRFGCRSYRLSPPKDGAAWILPNPESLGFTLSRVRSRSTPRPATARLMLPPSGGRTHPPPKTSGGELRRRDRQTHDERRRPEVAAWSRARSQLGSLFDHSGLKKTAAQMCGWSGVVGHFKRACAVRGALAAAASRRNGSG
jgi:hypothetical protein